ncbi:MAG: hypothetical protein AAF502_05225 [Bacteroidota bacterium]
MKLNFTSFYRKSQVIVKAFGLSMLFVAFICATGFAQSTKAPASLSAAVDAAPTAKSITTLENSIGTANLPKQIERPYMNYKGIADENKAQVAWLSADPAAARVYLTEIISILNDNSITANSSKQVQDWYKAYKKEYHFVNNVLNSRGQ